MDKSCKFIQATKEFNTFEQPVPAPYLRKSFTVDVACTATVTVAACGFYELYLNGTRRTKGVLAPYISNPDHFIYYDEYELPLDAGENVLGLLLGNGFQNNPGGYIWNFDQAPWRSAPMVAIEIRYPSANGETVTVSSDSSFKTASSPIRSDDYRFGETYDANFEIIDWCCKGFDDSAWQNALEVQPPRGQLRRCAADPILVQGEMKPVKIWQEDDAYIYDFGVSHAGVCRLTVQGKAGQRISWQHADGLRDGKFDLAPAWFVRERWEYDRKIVHKDTYICKGEDVETYTPTITYHGFRYVRVTGITAEQATPELLTFVILHSDLKSRGGFSCSDETVNQLQEMTRRSDVSNFHYFPTDCPQREKNGWTADAALSSEQTLINFNPEVSYREWLHNICKAQRDDGALPGIIPTAGWGYGWGNGPAWDCVLVYLPYFTYIYRGETDMVRECAKTFMAYLHYLTTRVDEKGLMHIGLGDWCHIASDTPKAPLELTDTILSMDIAQKMAVLFDAAGMTAQGEFARTVADGFKRAAREHLIDYTTMTALGNCQTSQAMCLFYGIFAPEEQEAAFAKLLELVHDADDHLDVGVLGGRVLFHVLSQFGQTDLALKLIIRPDFPSYGNWIARGATTLWESFWPENTRIESLNHHFWGDISAWFIKVLAGIRINPYANDVNCVAFCPQFAQTLTHAEGYYNAPAGTVRSAWKREGELVRLTLTIPEGMTAELIVPQGYSLKNKPEAIISGEYLFCKL